MVKNIYYSPDIDQSDYSDARTYHHDASGKMELMHLGSYFDPGMEFGDWFDRLDQHTKQECEVEFDRPFSGTGIRIIKSHVFMYHINFLRKNWPDSPIVLVHRDDDSCLGWWVKCGHFDITYPDYHGYYRDLRYMAQEIRKQNSAMRPCWEMARFVFDNQDLCQNLDIKTPPDSYKQNYAESQVQVKVLKN